MALMERVTTLLRANLNEMVERAEDPEKLLKQLLLDMENQLLQVKTQVAVAVADQHMLEKKRAEHARNAEAWREKARLALRKQDDELARAALERSLVCEQTEQSYAKQLEEQRMEAEAMRHTYTRLQQKLADTEAEGDLLLAARRRAKNGRPTATTVNDSTLKRALKRLRNETAQAEAQTAAARELEGDTERSTEHRFQQLEREERIEALLLQMKNNPRLLSDESA